MKNQETPVKNPHAGHRKRLRERYVRSGMDDFADHEVIELLLTYAIPRVNVNEQAHALIERFGSVAGVMDAAVEELCEVKGIGFEAARFLKLLPEVFRRYQLASCDGRLVLDTMAKLGDYLHARYTGVAVERVYLLLLNNSLKVIDCVHLGDGSVNCSSVTVRTIAEHALRKNAAAVVLAHNHPRGLAIPSGADLEVTRNVECALETIGVPLLEHMIVTENNYAPILRHHKGLLRASPRTGQIDREFYQRFYGES
jgi:DNA repair protein RadC